MNNAEVLVRDCVRQALFMEQIDGNYCNERIILLRNLLALQLLIVFSNCNHSKNTLFNYIFEVKFINTLIMGKMQTKIP